MDGIFRRGLSLHVNRVFLRFYLMGSPCLLRAIAVSRVDGCRARCELRSFISVHAKVFSRFHVYLETVRAKMVNRESRALRGARPPRTKVRYLRHSPGPVLSLLTAVLRAHGMSDWGSISLLGSRTRRAELDPTYNTPTLPSGRLRHSFHCCAVQHRFEVQPGNNIADCW